MMRRSIEFMQVKNISDLAFRVLQGWTILLWHSSFYLWTNWKPMEWSGQLRISFTLSSTLCSITKNKRKLCSVAFIWMVTTLVSQLLALTKCANRKTVGTHKKSDVKARHSDVCLITDGHSRIVNNWRFLDGRAWLVFFFSFHFIRRTPSTFVRFDALKENSLNAKVFT